MARPAMNQSVAALTVGQLKAIIRESIEETIAGIDPDAGLRLKPEVAERLHRSLTPGRRRLSHADFWKAVEQ